MKDLDNKEDFSCEQAQVPVTFQWNAEPIAGGMESDAYQKIGLRKCSGSRTEHCPVHRKNEPPTWSNCNFFRSLLGRTKGM